MEVINSIAVLLMLITLIALEAYNNYCVIETRRIAESVKLYKENKEKIDFLMKMWHYTFFIIRIPIISYLASMWIGNYQINFVILSLIYWILFDGILNKFREKHILYVGFTSDTDVMKHKIANKLNVDPRYMFFAFKIILLLTSIYIKYGAIS